MHWLFDLLRGVLLPPLGLVPSLDKWEEISRDLREPPRKRQLQSSSILV